MSYMNEFEQHARQSRAMTLLNNIRRKLKPDAPTKIRKRGLERELEALKDAVEFCRDHRALTIKPKVVIYSSRGLGSIDNAASVHIFQALDRAIEHAERQGEIDYNSYMNLLDKLIDKTSELSDEERDNIRELLSATMSLIKTVDSEPSLLL